ncbi:MAG: IS110 family transposase, partial [Acidobacteriota bacterium]|nr:IS110 family transposase [Acidobacteriota bacterium]
MCGNRFFPQALEWIGDVASVQACDFLTRWPTLAALQRARPRTVRQFYRAHNCRKADVIEARLAAMADARALTTDAAVVEPFSLSVQA